MSGYAAFQFGAIQETKHLSHGLNLLLTTLISVLHCRQFIFLVSFAALLSHSYSSNFERILELFCVVFSNETITAFFKFRETATATLEIAKPTLLTSIRVEFAMHCN